MTNMIKRLRQEGRRVKRYSELLTDEMKRVVEKQRLGFVATVCADGTPNLSPKGTLRVLDDDHLMFADIRSPGTVANLRTNPSIEVNEDWRPFRASGCLQTSDGRRPE